MTEKKYNIAAKVGNIIYYHPSDPTLKAKLKDSDIAMKFLAAREIRDI